MRIQVRATAEHRRNPDPNPNATTARRRLAVPGFFVPFAGKYERGPFGVFKHSEADSVPP